MVWLCFFSHYISPWAPCSSWCICFWRGTLDPEEKNHYHHHKTSHIIVLKLVKKENTLAEVVCSNNLWGEMKISRESSLWKMSLCENESWKKKHIADPCLFNSVHRVLGVLTVCSELFCCWQLFISASHDQVKLLEISRKVNRGIIIIIVIVIIIVFTIINIITCPPHLTVGIGPISWGAAETVDRGFAWKFQGILVLVNLVL